MGKIDLISSDKINFIGNYYPADTSRGALLLHMYKRSKEDWKDFAQLLNSRGYKVLAMDLRGHGESGGHVKEIFSQDLNPVILKDLELFVNFLKKEGAKNIFIIGASIGANAALIYGAKNNLAGVALLSPGLDYHGVKIENSVKKYSTNIFLSASEDDSYSFDSVKEVYRILPVEEKRKTLVLYKNAGHGTQMFNREEPNLSEKIIEWMDSVD